MSGPSILAQAAGANALDEMFRAIAEATIGAAARAKASDANTVWTPGMDLAAWLREALAPGARIVRRLPRAPPVAARARSRRGSRRASPRPCGARNSRSSSREGYKAIECDGVITGEATRERRSRSRCSGSSAPRHVGAERAWRFAQAAWRLAIEAPARLEVLLDCESHAARLEDEKVVLTEYIVDMGVALAALAARGTHVELTILDRAGGGVYVALAAPATRVAVVFGADIQVLPGAAVASILGAHRDAVGDIADYRRAGVADEEHKLGLPP